MIVHTFEPVSLVIELGQTVTGAVHDAEDLGERQHEVENLRQEEQEHGLGKVAQDTHHGEGHSRKVAEGVAHKDF
jgi:hypothetical protein